MGKLLAIVGLSLLVGCSNNSQSTVSHSAQSDQTQQQTQPANWEVCPDCSSENCSCQSGHAMANYNKWVRYKEVYPNNTYDDYQAATGQ